MQALAGAEYHYALGRSHKAKEALDLAEQEYREALRLRPGYADAWVSLGILLRGLGRAAEAEQCQREALLWEPTHFPAMVNLANALMSQNRFEHAARVFEVASRLRPGSIETRLMLASTLRTAGKLEEASQAYEALLRQDPQSPLAKGGLAATLADLGQYTKPRALFEQAIAGAPDDPLIQFAYSLFLLRSGDFGKGWPIYESRWLSGRSRETLERGFSQPRWQGEPLEGKRLLVCCEQGLGDELMFSSVLPDVLREASHCIVECDKRLEPLLARSFPAATIFGVDRTITGWNRTLETSENPPSFDYWTPAGTLPAYRRADAGSFPNHTGYLRADAARTQRWKDRFDTLGPGLKIGISWRGGTSISRQSARSMSLEQLRPLLGVAGAHFVSLQYGDVLPEVNTFRAASGIPLEHWPEAINDYDETASLVCALDLVISVCTAVVHLGGALGCPVWVMTPAVAEWRYGNEDTSMIWYPSVRLFRQPTAGAWTPVITQVMRALQKARRGDATIHGKTVR